MNYKVIKEIGSSKGRKMALATIIKATGSTPRHEGTNMLVFEDGKFAGTVGGGSGEERIRQAALEVIANKKTTYSKIVLNDDVALKEGMICGGTMETYIEYIEDASMYEEATRLIENSEIALMVTDMKSSEKALFNSEGVLLMGNYSSFTADDIKSLIKNSTLTIKDQVYTEVVMPFEKMVIFGGGHVSIPISEIASRIDFEVTVVDDREYFANRDRFPWVDRIICKDFDEALDEIEFDDNTYIVLVTRGHSYDTICLRKILKSKWKYVGMIGSKKRVITLLNNLEKEGYNREDLNRINTPIGLSIGAETPDEIAISVLSEIIAVKRGKIANFVKKAN